MKLVKEALDFEQDGDPYQMMNIGKYDDNYDWDNPEDGDRVELQNDLFYTHDISKDFERRPTFICKEDIDEYFERKIKISGAKFKGQIFELYNSYKWVCINWETADDYGNNAKKIKNKPLTHDSWRERPNFEYAMISANNRFFKKLRQ